MSDPLVSAAWLAEHLDDPKLIVIDASWHLPAAERNARAEYAAGHIPGAVLFDIDEICDHSTTLPHMLAPPADFAVAVRRLGVSQSSFVVAYDSLGLFSAARVWWNFRAMGHGAVSVLDGGLPRWIAEGHPLETGWRTPSHGDFKARPALALVADKGAIRRAVEGGGQQIVDARAADRFSGAAPEPRAGLRRGHMPGARNVPWSALVTGGALQGPEALKEAFVEAGVDLVRPITTTCGSGISAALLALALTRIGRDDAAVYDGSWAEWGALEDAPIETGSA
ncbi:MAG TPA: 3-mercaptopyruvate sulfurtransferase [Caulobacteraceae bacterium]|jgi:thiosulfate/3-mercaptopyruvate sulfurtransferase